MYPVTESCMERYFVVFHEEQWKIRHNGQHSGPYPTQAEAMDAAIDAAKKDGERGQRAQVLVHGEDLRFYAKWTYGQDPYPLHENA